MRILMINVVCGIRSTGRICTDLAVELEAQGHEVKIAYGRGAVPEQYQRYAIRVGNDLDVVSHAVKARCCDAAGFGSRRVTRRFIEWVKFFNPDVIHLHNIHGYYINIEELFRYLKTCGKRILWTLHDCWAITGHSAFCEASDCEKWKTGCLNCPKTGSYPASLIDKSKTNWYKKKAVFSGVPDLNIITPSIWLKKIVEQSFLKEYPVTVINNGVDTVSFHPTYGNLRDKLGIKNKKVILGVASVWEERKGLRDFISLSKCINNEECIIILVGLTERQIKRLPENIIGMERTDSIKQLAELYTLAEVFVNPTYEDNYPSVNLEAIACGTPVVTYMTGGSGESAEIYGKAINKSVTELYNVIMNDLPAMKKKDVSIDNETMTKKYLSLY